MPRRTEVMPPSKPRESDPRHSHKRDHSTSLWWKPALGNLLLQLQGGSGPDRSAGRYSTQMNELTDRSRTQGSSQSCLLLAPATRGIPARETSLSPLLTPRLPALLNVEAGWKDDRNRRCPLGTLLRPHLPGQSPLPLIGSRAGRRGRGGGSCAEAAPPLPSERPEPGPAPRALLRAGRDPRVQRLK